MIDINKLMNVNVKTSANSAEVLPVSEDKKNKKEIDYNKVINILNQTTGSKQRPLYQDDIKNYQEYGVIPNVINTQEELDRERAENQSAWEQAGRSLLQMGVNEVVLGTLLGLSNAVDFVVNIGKEKGEDDYTNPVSLALEEAQNSIRERFEIYREDPNQSWAINDFGWWADNAVSIASTASMLLPTLGITKGVSLVGKLGKGSGWFNGMTRGIAKAASKARLTTTPNKLAKSINTWTNTIGNAVVSRTLEGYLEARGIYNEVYDKTLSKVKDMTVAEKATLFENNPELVGKSDEEIASYISSVSADKTFRNDYAMLLFDIPQFKALGNLFEGAGKTMSTADTRIANRNAIRSLTDDAANALEKTNWLARRKEAITYALKNPLTSIGAIEWSEGIEEMYQGISGEKGKEVAELFLNPAFKTRSLESYLTDGHIWEQGFWGILGGVGFQTVGQGLGNLTKKAKATWDKKHMSEQEFALAHRTYETMQTDEINSRRTKLEKLIELQQLVNRGENPYAPIIDPATGKQKVVDGVLQYEKLNSGQIDDVKAKILSDFVTEMALDSYDAGTFDLFKEYIESKELNDYLVKNGIQSSVTGKQLSNLLLEQMDTVADYYENELSNILRSVDPETAYTAKKLARQITRNRLQIDANNEKINALRGNILEEAADKNVNGYIEKEIISYANNILAMIDAAEKETRDDYAKKNISREAYEENLKALDEKRTALLNWMSERTSFGARETVKSVAQQIAKKAKINVQSFINEYNNFVTEFGSTIPTTEEIPLATTRDKIEEMVELEYENAVNKFYVPNTDQEYKDRFEEFAIDEDLYTILRYNKAADQVSEWINKQDDLEKAKEDVISGNVPEELREAIKILKIGHHSTKKYVDAIEAAVNIEFKDRQEKEKQAQQVTENGAPLNATEAAATRENVESVSEQREKTATTEVSPSSGVSPSTGEEVGTPAATSAAPSPVSTSKPKIEEAIAPVEQYREKIAEASSAEETLARQQAEQMESLDESAYLIANDVVRKLLKDDKQLFTKALGKDFNSQEVIDLIDAVVNKLIEAGVSKGIAKKVAVSGIKTNLKPLVRQLERKGDDRATKFADLAAEVATHATDRSSMTTDIQEENDKLIEEFLEEYANNNGLLKYQDKTVIDLFELFKELLNNDNIGVHTARYIYYNLRSYIESNKYSNKYLFKNRIAILQHYKNPYAFFRKLLTKTYTPTIIDTYMHINISSNVSDKSIFKRLKNGDKLGIQWTKRDNIVNTNSISITYGKQEVGYIASVFRSSDNNTLSLKKVNKGLRWRVSVGQNGQILSNLDKLFDALINQDTEDSKRLFDILYRAYLYTDNKSNLGDLTNEETNFLWNTIIGGTTQGILTRDDIVITDYRGDPNYNATELMIDLKNILFFDGGNISKAKLIESYNNWKQRVYNNYSNTLKIQEQLEKDLPIQASLAGLEDGELIYTTTNVDVNTLNFDSSVNTIVGVMPNQEDLSIDMVDESDNVSYNNITGFEPGTMGFMVRRNNESPAVALITESNKVTSNDKIAKLLTKELKEAIMGYQNGSITFDDLYSILSDLFSGPELESNNIFSGYNVLKTSRSIALNINGQKGKYNLFIYKTKKNSTEPSTEIMYTPNGDEANGNYISKEFKESTVDVIVKEIVDNLTFNKTFYALRYKNEKEHTNNRFIQKKDGKLIINLGGETFTYDNFADFAIKENIYKTNQGVNAEGGYFEVADNTKSMYIDVKTLSPVEGTLDKTADQLLDEATEDKPIDSKQFLESVGTPKEQIDVLTGNNEYGISVVPEDFDYNDADETRDASYNTETNRVSLTKRGRGYILGDKSATSKASRTQRGNRAVRLLIHEGLHKKFAEQGLFERQELVEEIIDLYKYTIDAINRDATNGNTTAQKIKEWIEKNKLTPTEYFDNFDEATREKYSEEEKNRIFAEEWLVECLTRKELVDYLSNTLYKEDVKIADVAEENKTIWQKIIDVLLKLFGVDLQTKEKNTIFAKQYAILGSQPISNNNQPAEVTTTAEPENKPTKRRKRTRPENSYGLDFNSVTTDFNSEEQQILNNASRDSEGRLLAPNGKPSNLTEKQYAQVRTKAFINWFGDWINDLENASKVVDENGEPLVVYHGSRDNTFTIFDATKNDKGKKGFFFTDSKNMAKTYGETRAFFLNSREPYIINGKGANWNNINIYTSDIAKDVIDAVRLKRNALKLEVEKGKFPIENYDYFNDNFFKYLDEYNSLGTSIIDKIRKAIIINKFNKLNTTGQFLESTRQTEAILEYDTDDVSMIFSNIKDYGPVFNLESSKDMLNNIAANVYVVTNPNNIKSATDNIGTFSTTDNNIYASVTSDFDIATEYYEQDDKVNPNGVQRITKMDDYINLFSEQDKPLIAAAVESNEVRFACK